LKAFVDGGQTWIPTLLDISASPPDCSEFSCGWAFLGPGIAMTSDSSGQLYVLWNSGALDKGPERIYYSTSRDQGNSWSPRADVSLAPQGVDLSSSSSSSGSSRTRTSAKGPLCGASCSGRALLMPNSTLASGLDRTKSLSETNRTSLPRGLAAQPSETLVDGCETP